MGLNFRKTGIGCHTVMCWYELAIQFLGLASAWLNSPVLPGSSPGSFYYWVGKPLSKDLNLPPPPKKDQHIKNGISLMKRVLSQKNWVFSCEKGCFPAKKGAI